MSERLVVIGRITRPHGIRGELRVMPTTDRPERFLGLARCVLWDASRDERETRRITTARRHGEVVLLGLEGCTTMDAAQALAGRLVTVPASEALPLPPGHFYPWQLEGARVTTEDGRDVGEFVGLEPAGVQDVWVVRNRGREHLIPAVPDIVLDVDVAGRRVVIRPPEGLLEL